MPSTVSSVEIGDGAASAVEQRVLGWCRSHEGATAAEKREAAKLIMEGFVQAYDDKAAACRASGLPGKKCAAYPDVLDAAISSASKEFRAKGRTPASYDATVGRLLGLLGKQYGISPLALGRLG